VGEIVVDQPRLAALVAEHERSWQRAPSVEEQQRMIDAWVRDEIFYREGLKEGLEVDDVVVRRRVVQKMAFLAEGMAANVPGDAEVKAWFEAHADAYRTEPTYTLRQVFFDSRRLGTEAETPLTRAQAALEADARADVGDPSTLPSELRDAAVGDVKRVFGDEFAAAVPTLKNGTWVRVRSSFGEHLVRLERYEPARVPELAAVRAAVERDLAQARTAAALEAFYRNARARYDVRYELSREAMPALSSSAAQALPAAR
jgi:parvulin-like peptidyl-prolyl isomerase